MAAPDQALVDFALRLGDGCLILGQRLSALCGHGPMLEEDIATTNVALDLIGQAQNWLAYAGEVEAAGRDADALAYDREAHAFRNPVLVEQPNGHFGETIARQFYFDSWHYLLLARLLDSTDATVAGIAGKSIKEVRYHVERSGDWVVRLGDGTADSHACMQAALERLWDTVGDLFAPGAAHGALVQAGVAPDLADLREPWTRHVQEVIAEATLTLPAGPQARCGGAPGRHSEHLSVLLADMQSLHRAHPGARW